MKTNLIKFQNKINNMHNNLCSYCKVKIKRGISLHLDYIVPLSCDGSHIKEIRMIMEKK